MRVIFSERAFAAVLAETTEKIKTETGGLFLGTVKEDVWYIIEAIDPGPKSIFEVAYFEYDQKYTEHLINKIANLYNHKLELIGLWHRHPGSFDQFSSTDDGTNAKYALMRKEGAISALVNIDPEFRLTMRHVAQPCRYRIISYEVGDNLIPNEYLIYKTPDRFYELMKKRSESRSQHLESQYQVTLSLESFMRLIIPYLEECENQESEVVNSNVEELVDEVVDDLAYLSDTVGIMTTASMDERGLILEQDAIEGTTILFFSYSEKEKQTILEYNGIKYLYHRGIFKESAQKVQDSIKKKMEQKEKRQGGLLGSMFKLIK